jgi:putative FmdB family regulatory protein
MPLYEYQCGTCSHRFEVLQKRADAQIEICPSCGGPVHKLQSAPAFQFKGTGWYVTDYPKKDHSSSKDADSKDGGQSSADKSEKADKGDKTDSKNAEGSKSTSSSDSSTSTSSSTPSPSSSTKP